MFDLFVQYPCREDIERDIYILHSISYSIKLDKINKTTKQFSLVFSPLDYAYFLAPPSPAHAHGHGHSHGPDHA